MRLIGGKCIIVVALVVTLAWLGVLVALLVDYQALQICMPINKCILFRSVGLLPPPYTMHDDAVFPCSVKLICHVYTGSSVHAFVLPNTFNLLYKKDHCLLTAILMSLNVTGT